ncbi:MAG: hypothetical protein J2P28_06890 [Actinobacteria bacterium]|nr:hypothetical protein [Actinomycetota bacterium]
MTQPDLEARVAALESRVDDLDGRVRRSEQDAAAARVLAGGADRDMSEVRTEIREFRDHNTRVLNAMREDLADMRSGLDAGLSEMRGGLGEMRGGLHEMRGGLHEMRTGFAEIRGRLDATAAGQQQIADMLTTLIEREDQ